MRCFPELADPTAKPPSGVGAGAPIGQFAEHGHGFSLSDQPDRTFRWRGQVVMVGIEPFCVRPAEIDKSAYKARPYAS